MLQAEVKLAQQRAKQQIPAQASHETHIQTDTAELGKGPALPTAVPVPVPMPYLPLVLLKTFSCLR